MFSFIASRTRLELRKAATACVAAVLAAALAACGGGGGGGSESPPPAQAGPPDAGPRIESFSASRTALPAGGGLVHLTWNVQGADSTRLSRGIGVVAGNGADAQVTRTTRFTLTATRGEREARASVLVQVETPALAWSVNPGLAPAQVVRAPDGSALPLAASEDERGVRSTFVAHQLLVRSKDAAELDRIVQRVGGRVVADNAVPAAEPGWGVELSTQDRAPTLHVVQVDPSRLGTDGLADAARAVGLGGTLNFSSRDAAALSALVWRELAAGSTVALNHVAEPAAVLNSTRECQGAARCRSNAFEEQAFGPDGNRSDVLGAWQIVAAGNVARRVRVAIIDGGFWIDPATGLPREVSGVGHDLPPHLQRDFAADRPNVGAPNPVQCGGSPCPWHGHGVANVATGVLDNRQGAAGTGGQVADALLFHVDLTDAQVERALRTARRWGADIVNMSFGMSCNAACELSTFFDADPLYDELVAARAAGLFVVAAAGNDGADVNAVERRPCTLEAVFCVGSLANGGTSRFVMPANSQGNWTSASGASVLLYAPTNIPAVSFTNARGNLEDVGFFGGTSASAPFVAGVAAMMKALNPSLSGSAIGQMLLDTAWTDSPDPSVARYLNAHAAVRRAAAGQLARDALEGTSATLRSGALRDLTLHDAADRDSFSLTIGDHRSLLIEQLVASRLGLPDWRVVMTHGCDAPRGVRMDAAGAPQTGRWDLSVDYLPPGQYTLSLGSRRRDGLAGGDLAAYGLDTTLRPLPLPALTADGHEFNDTWPFARELTPHQAPVMTFHQLGDVDHYIVRGGRPTRFGPLNLGTRFSIAATTVRLRATLLDFSGAPTGHVIESDPDCREPMDLMVPAGDHIVRVEALQPSTGWYTPGVDRGILGVFVPHAPLRFEPRRGLPIDLELTDPVVHHLYAPDPHGVAADLAVHLQGDGVQLALVNLQGEVVDIGAPVNAPGQTAVQRLSLRRAVAGEVYFLAVIYEGAVAGVAGRLPARPYRLVVD